MKRSIRMVTALLWLTTAVGCTPGPEEGDGEAHGPSAAGAIPEGQLPDGVVPEFCHLALEIIPDSETFSGRVEISVRLEATLDGFWMHGQGLEVTDAALVLADSERIPAVYQQVHRDGIARITLAREAGPGEAVLELAYTGELSDSFAGPFRVEEGGDAYVFSEFEPNMARRAFPGFDEPRFKVPFQVELTTSAKYVALSNGAAIGEENLGDGLKRVRFSETRPLPAYLVAFAVGPLDVVDGPPVPANAWRQDSLPLRGVAPRGKGSRLDFALANTAIMVNALETYFETPYPYDKLDLVAVPGYSGAMENAGLLFYAEDLLLLGDHPPFRQLEAFGSTHAHELAHQWLGNLVTMTWWDDLWLNEASADWMAGKIMAIWRPDLHYDRTRQATVYRAMDDDSLASSRRVREPVVDAAGMFAAFDNLTYVKGAAVLGMLESHVGEEAFRDTWQVYLSRFRDRTATVFDFIEALNEVVGDDSLAGDIFLSFLEQPGVPVVIAAVRCTPEAAVVSLEQRRYLPLGADADAAGRWSIPVCIRRYPGEAEDGPGRCPVISDTSQELSLGSECPRWIMPDRGAAGYYRWMVDPAEYLPLDGAGRVLTDLEGMSLADSLASAVHAGALGAGQYLAAVPDIAAALERAVSLAPLPELRRMFDFLIGPQDEAQARAYLGAIYQRRLEFLDRPGGGEAGPERERFRAGLVSFLAETVRDETLRGQMSASAIAYTGYGDDGKIHEDALSPDLVRTALLIGIQDLDEAFFDHLLRLLENEDTAAVRRDLLYALGSPEQPLLLSRARNLLLDERVRNNEVSMLLWRLTRPARAVGTLEWFEGNHAAAMSRIPEGWRWDAPLYFASLCDAGDAVDLERIFDRYEDSIPGTRTALRQALEQVAICRAYRERHEDEVGAFFRTLGRDAIPGGGRAFAAGGAGR